MEKFLLFVCVFVSVYCLEENCQSKNLYLQDHLAVRTPYRFIANNNASKFNFEGCTPTKIWMIIRHGTRYPGVKIISKMQKKLTKFRNKTQAELSGSLCKSEIEALINWKPRVQLIDDKNLSHEGEDEMIELAERFKIRFPELFPNEYSNSTYKFKYTATQRTAESARHFTIGLFGRKVSRYVWFPEPEYGDPILRFYKICGKWEKEVKKNDKTYENRKMFEKSEVMNKTITEVTKRLGLSRPVSLEILILMYVTCGFETAWSSYNPSPWCSAFSNESLKVMEYAEDLKFYWTDGYGYNLTYKQACPAIKNLFEFFDVHDNFKTVAYFTHSGTLLKLLSHLGLYNESKPLTYNEYELNSDRQWRTSLIDTFGSNLAFVLYNCNEKKYVLTLHQEQIVNIPGCPINDLCPLQTLKELFSNSINNCLFNEMCDYKKENKK